MENTLYFAYGSNINLNQMEYRCPDASVVGPVVLEGWELLFRRGGFATIAPKEGKTVQGLLWSSQRQTGSAGIKELPFSVNLGVDFPGKTDYNSTHTKRKGYEEESTPFPTPPESPGS